VQFCRNLAKRRWKLLRPYTNHTHTHTHKQLNKEQKVTFITNSAPKLNIQSLLLQQLVTKTAQ